MADMDITLEKIARDVEDLKKKIDYLIEIIESEKKMKLIEDMKRIEEEEDFVELKF